MATSPEEQKDLDEVQKRLRLVYESAITMSEHFERMLLKDLEKTGNRSKDEAIVRTVRAAIKRKAEIIAAHIKKWPDK